MLYASLGIIAIFPISVHSPAAATCLSPLASPDLAPTAAFFSPLDLDLDLRRSTAAFVLPMDLDLDLRPGTADGGGGLGGDLGGLKSRVDEADAAAAFSLRLLASPDMAPAAAMFLPLDLDLDLRRGTVDGGSGLGGDLGGLSLSACLFLAACAVNGDLGANGCHFANCPNGYWTAQQLT